MTDRGAHLRSNEAQYARLNALPVALPGIVYLAGYVLLDWSSFIEPFAPFGITPWNPGTGLSFALVLLYGRRTIPFLFVAPLLSDLVQSQAPLPWPLEIASVALIGGVYAAGLNFLLRPEIKFDPALPSMRDLGLLVAVAIVSAAVVAGGYVAMTTAAGLLPIKDFAAATLRYWLGDIIGIVVFAPFTLMALTRKRLLPASFETLLQFVAIVGALVLVFGFTGEQRFQLFYVLFLPVVWMAVRTGTEGVAVGILFIQLGLIAGLVLFAGEGHNVTAFQALMLVLAMTGLIAGELVSERRRTELQLRLHRESLSRLSRLGSLGELAAAVAHELNQPLMAAGTYTRLVDDAIRSHSTDTVTIAETAKKAAAQVERAAAVVQRLRALVRLDRGNRVPCGVERIVRETLALCQPEIDRSHADVRIVLPAGLSLVMVDLLQIEQVVLNLLHNAIEATDQAGTGGSAISIEASPAGTEFVEVSVSDNGPGFPPEISDNLFLPFSSTKPEGLGFGLPLCKSIIEAHGGRLWLTRAGRGAAVHFTLPVAAAS